MEWRTCCCLYSENEIEREKERVHPSVFFPPTPPRPNPGAAALLIGEQEERGGAGSTDQG